MKSINNQKGSAMLWTILLTVIVTILLGAISTSATAYFNYTMRTVKRQQAYFTARSATSIILDEFSSTSPNEDPRLLPKYGNKIVIDNFNFGDELKRMGTASAVIERGGLTNKDRDTVNLSVTAKYADEEYTLNTEVIKQPIFFAGIAIKNITSADGQKHTLKLGQNTDLYWDNDATFNPEGSVIIEMDGNLVSKKEMVIPRGSTVAKHTFPREAKFGGTNRQKSKIWSSTEYILADNPIDIKTTVDNRRYSCNSGFSYLLTRKDVTETNNPNPGNFGDLAARIANNIGDVTGDFLGVDNLLQDYADRHLSLKIKKGNATNVGFVSITKPPLFRNRDYCDVSFIDRTIPNWQNREDDITPLFYIKVWDRDPLNPFGSSNYVDPINLRIKYGRRPDPNSKLVNFVDKAGNLLPNAIENIFNVDSKMSYCIVNLEKNTTIELGADATRRGSKDPNDLVFAYTILGGEGTTVILNDGVTVLGEIYCDNLVLKGNAKVVYTNSSGSQIAKQEIARIWTPIGYSQGRR